MSEWVSVKDRLPEKPGLVSYEHVYCLIFYNGDVLLRPWNCEHLCWDDESGDDFELKPKDPTHWMLLPSGPNHE